MARALRLRSTKPPPHGPRVGPWAAHFCLVGVSLAFGSFRVGADEPKVLVWRGCEVAQEAFMTRCAAAYERKTGVRVRVTGGGTTIGIESVADGTADVGGSCRSCLAARGENALPLRLVIVAWDAVVVVVHPTNPIDGLTIDAVRGVFTERIRDWKEVGGPARRIAVVTRRDAQSGVGVMSRRMFFGDDNARFGDTVIRLPQGSESVEEMVERYPHAIAFSGASSASRRGLKLLAIDGVAPTRARIATGEYPHYRPLFLTYRTTPTAPVLALRDWMLSPEGQATIVEAGTIGLDEGRTLVKTYRHFEVDGPPIDNLESLRALADAPR